MNWLPHVTVATTVEINGRFLLVLEKIAGREVYNQPAGHLEPNESLIDAAIRETREETGWLVAPTSVLGITVHNSSPSGETYVRVSFTAKAIKQDKLAKLDSAIIKPVWLSYEQIEAVQQQLRSSMVLNDVNRFRAGLGFGLELLSYIPVK